LQTQFPLKSLTKLPRIEHIKHSEAFLLAATTDEQSIPS